MWLHAIFSADPRSEAASRIQAIARGHRTRSRNRRHHESATSSKARSLVTVTLRELHASCDLVDSGASCSELLERIAGNMQLLEALDELRPNGAAKVLRCLNINRWLESDGRVSLAALLALA